MPNVKWYHQCAIQLINADYNILPVDDLESPVQLPLANVSGVKPTFGVHCKPRPLRVPAMQCKHRVDIEIFFLRRTKNLHFVSTTDFLQHLTYICEWWRYLIMTIMQTESQRKPTFTFIFTFCVRVLECLRLSGSPPFIHWESTFQNTSTSIFDLYLWRYLVSYNDHNAFSKLSPN